MITCEVVEPLGFDPSRVQVPTDEPATSSWQPTSTTQPSLQSAESTFKFSQRRQRTHRVQRAHLLVRVPYPDQNAGTPHPAGKPALFRLARRSCDPLQGLGTILEARELLFATQGEMKAAAIA